MGSQHAAPRAVHFASVPAAPAVSCISSLSYTSGLGVGQDCRSWAWVEGFLD
jgi:hypothetical protein